MVAARCPDRGVGRKPHTAEYLPWSRPPSTSTRVLESGRPHDSLSAVMGTERGGISTEAKLACPVFKIGKNAQLILEQKALPQNDDFLPLVMMKRN